MKRSKVLPIIALLLIVLSLSYFSVYFSVDEMRSLLVDNAFISRQIEVNLIASMMEQATQIGGTWNVGQYEGLLKTLIEDLDANKFYIQMFDEDMNSVTIRNSLFGEHVFDPRLHEDFLEQVREHDRGTITVHTTAIPSVAPHDVHLYFRWVPMSSIEPDKRIIVVGASINTIERNIGLSLIVSVAAFLPFMLGMIVWIGVYRSKIEALKRENDELKREGELI